MATSGRVTMCEHIIYEHFGAGVGMVASILLARGRLSYETLLRLIPRNLKQSTVLASLLVLVQHNCLFHVLEEEEGLEYFEVNIEEVLQRRRFGTFIALSRDILGSKAAEVVAAVLAEGKIRLSTLLEECSASSTPSTSSSASIFNAEYRQTTKIIYDLLELGVLKPVTRGEQTSARDQDLQYEKQLLRQLSGPATSKELKSIKDQVFQRRSDLESQSVDWGKDSSIYAALCQEITCHSKEDNSHIDYSTVDSGSKKRKTASQGIQQKAKRPSLPFNDELYVRIIYTPFNIRLRNECIVKAVRAQRGGAAALLMQGLLIESVKQQTSLAEDHSDFVNPIRLVEPSNRRSPTRKPVPLPGSKETNGYHPYQDEHAFYTLFPPHDIPATLGLEPSGSWSASMKEPLDLIHELIHLLHNTADSRDKAGQVESEDGNIELLRSNSRANSWLLCSEPGVSRHDGPHIVNRASWAVDFVMAHETLKLGLLENYIRKKFGKEAIRIWRILDERGKMEEKHVAKLAMLPVKEVREVIASLSARAFIRQQEVPRTVDRNPSRTFFLWYVSRTACYQNLTAYLYETLINLQVRLEEEALHSRALLRKSERKDVQENKDLLDRGDREELRVLDWKNESLSIAKERIDRDIFVLEMLPTLGPTT